MRRKLTGVSAVAGCMLLFSACGNNNEEAADEIDENLQNDPAGEEEVDQENIDEPEEQDDELEDLEDLTYPQFEEDESNYPQAVLHTSMGEIELILFPEEAPLAVENFITLAEEGYYDEVIFHRVIENFMVQGGDPSGTGMGGDSAFGEPFEDEFDPSLGHFRGALSMANSGPDTNSSQFFIVQADESQVSEEMFQDSGFPEQRVEYYVEEGGTPHLDFQHTVFGHVSEGMDVVDEIAAVETESADKPSEDVVIESVEIVDEE
jgi:peptidyl-prolyl cis-trans isomerase B (cyclophilin B)